MTQVSLHQVEARRRRRYRIPSRTYFGYAVGFVEGLVALALALIAHAEPYSMESFVLPLIASVAYGVGCSVASAQFLQSLATRHPRNLRSLLTWLVGITFLIVTLALSGDYSPDGRWLLLLAGVATLVALRLAFVVAAPSLMLNGRLQIERVALVGRTDDLDHFRRTVQVWRQGAQVVRTLALEDGDLSGLDTAAFARDCIEARCVTVLLVGSLDSAVFDALLSQFRLYALNVMLSPAGNSAGEILVDLWPMGATQSTRVLAKPIDDTGRLLKRVLDVVESAFGLVLLSPLFLFVAMAIKLNSRGPVFFRQERKGFNGKSFRILKFRSMTVMEDGRAMRQAVAGDVRITRVGAVLRRSSIDELPQLLNVLRGDMSLVGPRPHAISHDAELARRFERYAQRQRIAPGITGWAQVNGFRGDTSTLEKIEGRTLHDLYYVEHWSIWFDIRILVLTFLSRKVRDNAH